MFDLSHFAVVPRTGYVDRNNAYSGFVILEIRRGYVAGYEVNQEAYDAWTPAPEPDPPDPGGGADQVYDELAAAIREGVNSI